MINTKYTCRSDTCSFSCRNFKSLRRVATYLHILHFYGTFLRVFILIFCLYACVCWPCDTFFPIRWLWSLLDTSAQLWLHIRLSNLGGKIMFRWLRILSRDAAFFYIHKPSSQGRKTQNAFDRRPKTSYKIERGAETSLKLLLVLLYVSRDCSRMTPVLFARCDQGHTPERRSHAHICTNNTLRWAPSVLLSCMCIVSR